MAVRTHEEAFGTEPGVTARKRRSGFRWVALGLAVALLSGIAAMWARSTGRADSESHSAAASATASARVERRDLVEEESFDGTLGYDDSSPVTAGLSGTITTMRPEGSRARRGQVLFEVDEHPVILLYGKKPAYRSLQSGVEDGTDVRQLEQNLVAMGYDPDGDIDVDREFDWATTEAIERWQDDRGLTEDGAVDMGEAVFAPGPVRIGSHQATVGSSTGSGTPVMDISSVTRVITVKVPVDQRALLRSGMKVDVDLPSGERAAGRIRSIGRVAEGGSEDEDATVEAEVVLQSAKGLHRYDETPVTVNVSSEVAKDALAVPVTALLALAEGGYAVEVVEGGKTELVAVDTGMFVNGYVEIKGSKINEGTKVVVPE